ncbi:MAG: helix-turn-helix transcriptional regulator [Pseudomonadales bacterium]|jgi:DNA-binding CsgD family transcriptional regulator|nr:helix-turn-helix transcriptional regulator [Pseudomonadales bacterium]
MRETARQELIRLAYEAAFREAGWPELLRRLTGVVGGSCAFLTERHGLEARMLHHSDPATRGSTRAYDGYWARRDPCIEPVNRLPPGFVTSGRTMVPTIQRTPFFHEYCLPAGRTDHLIVHAGGGGAHRSQILVARTPGDRPFGEREMDAVRFLVPHLLHAAQLRSGWRALGERADVLEEALEAEEASMLLLTAERHIDSTSRAAADLLGPGGPLRSRQGRLAGRTPQSDRALADAFGEVDREFHRCGLGVAECLLAHGHRNYRCRLRRPATDGAPDRILLVARPLREPALRPDRLALLRGLTRTEAEIVLALCAGRTAEAVAEARGVRVSTVRWHVRNALGKLGVGSLREAAWQLGALAAGLPPQD